MNRIMLERKRQNLTQEELAEKLNISQKSISKYETGVRKPSFDTLTAMAKLFGVSVDYLLGNSNSRNNNDYHSFFFFFFGCWSECKQRILQKLDELSISESDFIKDTGIDLEKEISIDDLIVIAKTLKVSIDYLLGNEKFEISHSQSTPQSSEFFLQTLSDRERKIIDVFRQLTEDNQDIIVGEMKKCLKEQRYEKSVAADEISKKTGTDNLGK